LSLQLTYASWNTKEWICMGYVLLHNYMDQISHTLAWPPLCDRNKTPAIGLNQALARLTFV
jgi:hypothetical protein